MQYWISQIRGHLLEVLCFECEAGSRYDAKQPAPVEARTSLHGNNLLRALWLGGRVARHELQWCKDEFPKHWQRGFQRLRFASYDAGEQVPRKQGNSNLLPNSVTPFGEEKLKTLIYEPSTTNYRCLQNTFVYNQNARISRDGINQYVLSWWIYWEYRKQKWASSLSRGPVGKVTP